jgi:hypothetical protein
MHQNRTIIAVLILILCWVGFCSPVFCGTRDKFNPDRDTGFYYTIQKGDTLWDLSRRFYNSEWDWPGLWEINAKIKNPHLIYPGRKIRVFLKAKSKLPPIIVTPEDKKPEKPVAKIVPMFSFPGMDHAGFIRSTRQKSLGKVLKQKDSKLMMSAGDIIYIKPSGSGALIPGRTYLVFNTKTVNQKINNKVFKGIQHIIKAKVKITSTKLNYATGIITANFRPVFQGDMIMQYNKLNPVLRVEDHPDPIDARIICAEDNNLMINDYIIAFINAGRSKVKPGQIYTAMKKNMLEDHNSWTSGGKKKNQMELESIKSGKMIVLRTEDIASTIMIISSKYDINPGDLVN